MRLFKLLTLIAMLVWCSSCGSNASNSPEITKAIAYRSSTPGNSAPDLAYTESITISENTMTVVRSGGARVVSGTWHVPLKDEEIIRINDLVDKADMPAVSDEVSGGNVYDAPYLTLEVGAKTFKSGIVDNQLHQFPAAAIDLASYLEALLLTYCGNRYS